MRLGVTIAMKVREVNCRTAARREARESYWWAGRRGLASEFSFETAALGRRPSL